MIKALLVLATLACPVSATPLEHAPSEHRAMFESIKPLILANARQPVEPLSESGESWFWVNSHKLSPLLDAYEYSGETAFLDVFVERMKSILSERYIHPTQPDTWSGWYHYKTRTHSYMVIHAGIVYYKPALRFVQFVRSNPDLQSKYGLNANIWLEHITNISIPAWDKRGAWKEMGEDEGWYVKLTQKPDPITHELIPEADRLAGTTYAYNKLHEMLHGFLLAYQVTGNEAYKVRVEKCARVFRRNWRIDDRHAEWDYREILGPWDYKSGKVDGGETHFTSWIHPKGDYYGTDVGYAVACYNCGIQFSKQDIEKLIQTNTAFMYQENNGSPYFTNIDGSYKTDDERGKSFGRGSLWTSLAQFSPRIRELWKAQIDRADPSKYGYANSVMSYLLAVSKPVT